MAVVPVFRPDDLNRLLDRCHFMINTRFARQVGYKHFHVLRNCDGGGETRIDYTCGIVAAWLEDSVGAGYGMMRRIRTSRFLEYACRHNIDFIWLAEGHTPAHSKLAELDLQIEAEENKGVWNEHQDTENCSRSAPNSKN